MRQARITSLDALRGLDMLVIIGVDALVYRLAPLYPDSSFMQLLRLQMGHCVWEGLRVYDLVFPLFVMMAGISMSCSFKRRISSGGGNLRTMGHLWYRALILVVLGWLINGELSWDPARMRYASVLGLIGLSGALSGSLILLSRSGIRGALLMVCGILLCVGGAQFTWGDFTPGGCLNSKIDTLLCPGVLHSVCYDPEGPLCIVSATALSLLGYATGRFLTQAPARGFLKVLIISSAGLAIISLGSFLPIIKGIWTPGFVLCCAGVGAILISLLYLVCDVMGYRKWTYPLVIIGSNALFIYTITHLISFPRLAERIFGGCIRLVCSEPWQPAAIAAGAILLAWLVCLFLYRRRIFIKL